MIVYVIQEIGGNENYPDSLNIMVNYYYHGENSIISRKFSSMVPPTTAAAEVPRWIQHHEAQVEKWCHMVNSKNILKQKLLY